MNKTIKMIFLGENDHKNSKELEKESSCTQLESDWNSSNSRRRSYHHILDSSRQFSVGHVDLVDMVNQDMVDGYNWPLNYPPVG